MKKSKLEDEEECDYKLSKYLKEQEDKEENK